MMSAVRIRNFEIIQAISLLMNKLSNRPHSKLCQKYVDAIEQTALSRRVSGPSGGGGGGTKRNRRRVDSSSTWLRLAASSTGGGGGWRRFRGLMAVFAQTAKAKHFGRIGITFISRNSMPGLFLHKILIRFAKPHVWPWNQVRTTTSELRHH